MLVGRPTREAGQGGEAGGMRPVKWWCLAAFLGLMAGCEDPQTSSSSHWLRCREFAECARAPAAVACEDGYCVDELGARIKATDTASAGRSGGDAALPGGGGDSGLGGGGGEAGRESTASDDRPPAGNPNGTCQVPDEASLVDTTAAEHVIGDGSPESCTSAAVVAAVAQGGVIRFDCGPRPKTITLTETAKIFNDAAEEVVIDGGGLVTLSGGNARRILYQNTCDEDQVWTTETCDNQDHPRLTLQNLTFIEGSSEGEELEGGGAIFVRGGRLTVHSCRFFNNTCDPTGPDVAGAALRVLDQYEDLPVHIVNSTFGGESSLGNQCSNGGGIGAIGVSFVVANSLFAFNDASGRGANPPREGTPGGGNGGAVYVEGDAFDLTLCGTRIEDNHANEGGGGLFFVSNDGRGTLRIEDSALRRNVSDGFETSGYPGVFVQTETEPQVMGSTLE